MENTAMLKEWFDRVDSARGGHITALQLKRALSVGNLEFSLSVVQQMIRMYDFNRNEFVALNKFLLKVQHAFSDLERGRGFLVPEDVHEALVKVGFMLDSPAFYTVCESFDQSRMKGFGLMTSYLSVYSYSLLGICSTHLIQRNKAESHLILTNLSIALAIVEYDSNI